MIEIIRGKIWQEYSTKIEFFKMAAIKLIGDLCVNWQVPALKKAVKRPFCLLDIYCCYSLLLFIVGIHC